MRAKRHIVEGDDVTERLRYVTKLEHRLGVIGHRSSTLSGT